MSALEGEDGTYEEELDEAALSSDEDDADEGDHEIGALEDIPDEISINMEELAQRLGRGNDVTADSITVLPTLPSWLVLVYSCSVDSPMPTHNQC